MIRKSAVALWIGVGLVLSAAITGLTYYGSRRPRNLKGSCSSGGHVGAKGFVWPHQDLFLDEAGFGAALEALGYDTGNWPSEEWKICEDPMVRAVREFQVDYNLALPTIGDPDSSPLKTTGFIDADTVRAIADVIELGGDWPILVHEIRSAHGS